MGKKQINQFTDTLRKLADDIETGRTILLGVERKVLSPYGEWQIKINAVNVKHPLNVSRKCPKTSVGNDKGRETIKK